MASKFTYEIGLDTKGYVDGVKQGKDANADFSTSIKRVKDNLPNLKKELRDSRKEAMGLALAYSKLSESEKQSGFGKALARELEEAKKRTAELVDMTGDLQNEFKNLASDTATWDAVKEGIGVAKDVATGFIGTIAALSGKEKELQPLIAKIAAVQGVANSAISIGNALQKQSSLMLGIRRIQEAALAKAIALETTATNGATVAQKAFNAVAKANPYVLLASAIIAVGAAIGGYILATSNAQTEEQKQQEELRKQQQEWKKLETEVNNSAASQLAQYKALQIEWNNLKTTQEKNQFLDDNKSKFQSMGFEIDNVNELEKLFTGNTSAVVAALKARAEAEAWGEIYRKKMEQKINNDLNGTVANGRYYKRAKAGDYITDEEAKATGVLNKETKAVNTTMGVYYSITSKALTAEEAAIVNAYRITEAKKKQGKETKELKKIQDGWIESMETAAEARSKLDKSLVVSNKSTKTPKTTTNKPQTTHKVDKNGNVVEVKVDEKELQAAVNSIEDLEKQASDLQSNLRKGLVPQDAVQITIERIKNLQDKIKTLKIQYGFEEPEKAKTKLEELQDKLSQAQKSYILAVDTNDEQAKQAALKAYYEAQKELNEYQLSIKIEPLPDPKEIAKQKNEVQKIVDDALNPKVKMEYDFSALQGKDNDVTFNAANKALADLKRVEEARDRLQEIMDDPSSSDAQISTAQQGLETLHDLWQQLIADVNLYKEANDELETVQKKNEDIAKGVQEIGQAVQATSSLFSALGEASDNEGMKAAGIVAQAVATIALSFAQAMTSASKNWVTWLTFGVTGLATMVTMISQVRQATSGGYAQGGVIPGSSYTGDRLMINANSGERVLTANQNKNFERLVNMLDHDKINSVGAPANVYVTGKIQGKDLLLVQRNANKVMHKSGQSINI